MKATVALPIYKMSRIAWLAFEGLIRQKTDHPWELIVCEEDHSESCARALIDQYFPRLADVGCLSARLIVPETWIPLSMKWREIGKHSTGEKFLLCAADSYPAPTRINDAVDCDADWRDEDKGLFFDIPSRRTILYTRARHRLTGQAMSFKGEYARNLPVAHVAKGVDRWLVNTCSKIKGKPLRFKRVRVEEFQGFESHGLNVISKGRGKLLNKFTWPFSKTKTKVEDFTPPEIMEKLYGLNKTCD